MSIRWGILGTGGIARTFTEDLLLLGHDVAAVGSRAAETAEAFAGRYGIGRAYGSYAELAADDGIDVVYVATPHSRHCDDTVLFLDSGKHVLCEKPLALNAAQVRAMTGAAARNDRFLMEALWSRFQPAYEELVHLLDDGAIGEPRLVEADFGFAVPVDPDHRLFDLAQGGGALLDLGIYSLNLAFLVLGHPLAVEAVADALHT